MKQVLIPDSDNLDAYDVKYQPLLLNNRNRKRPAYVLHQDRVLEQGYYDRRVEQQSRQLGLWLNLQHSV